MRILAINSGSSSLKFALYECHPHSHLLISGSFSRIGSSASLFKVHDHEGNLLEELEQSVEHHETAALKLISWIQNYGSSFDAVSHRIVQGGAEHRCPTLVSPPLLSHLKKLIPLAPDHLPQEIALIEIFQKNDPSRPQIACFDTSFHKERPYHRQIYALPRRFARDGILRYGFHGLSYESILKQLKCVSPQHAESKIIACHLGHGASIAAIENFQCCETTMGFTPVSGLVMSTRTGELDPEVMIHIQKEYGFSIEQMHQLIHQQSGLLALSEISGDMDRLLKVEKKQPLAKEAVLIFCESVIKHIGALTSLLGGLDTLTFSGGIGENSPIIRSRICQQLKFLGVSIDPEKNSGNTFEISNRESRVTTFVIPTNEEEVLITHAKNLLYPNTFSVLS